jgi:uncharacterized damage-inducible protein DinB
MSTISPTSQTGFFRVYLQLVKEKDLMKAFHDQSASIAQLLPSISEEKSLFAYARGKWTLREMLQHIIDAERIFAYRALSFARKESAILPPFDENNYADASGANLRSWESLCTEFNAVRKANLCLFESFTPEMLALTGQAGINSLSVEEVGFLIVGHFMHHQRIIEERYL